MTTQSDIFGDTVGVSLLPSCVLRLRRKVGMKKGERANLTAEPRSAYLLSGPARDVWEHSIPPMDALRYSITFRSLREGWHILPAGRRTTPRPHYLDEQNKRRQPRFTTQTALRAPHTPVVPQGGRQTLEKVKGEAVGPSTRSAMRIETWTSSSGCGRHTAWRRSLTSGSCPARSRDECDDAGGSSRLLGSPSPTVM